MILLGTDACSRIVRGGSKKLDARVKAIPPREVCEMLHGLARKPEATRLAELVQALLSRVRSLGWSNEAASHYAHIRAHL